MDRSVVKKSAKKKPAKPTPTLPRASEEIKRFASLLENEILAWPGVNSRPMFGFTGLYRSKIFAALPRTVHWKRRTASQSACPSVPATSLKR